jgi:lipopolysaccharide biosynthesis glycosyltransferase
MSINNKIHIFFQSSNEYSIYIPMNIYSILDHNKSGREYSFYVLESLQKPISGINKDKIIRVVNFFGGNHNIEFKQIDDMQFESANIPKWGGSYSGFKVYDETYDEMSQKFGSYAGNYKFLATAFFADLDKIMYLDIDAFCINDLSEFYDIDNENYALIGPGEFGEYDAFNPPFFDPNGLGIEPILAKDYINIGAMIMNLKLTRELGITPELLIAMHSKYNGQIRALEQDIHNIAFRGKIKVLRNQYAFLAMHDDVMLKRAIRKNPICVVHGLSYCKPWNLSKSFYLGKRFWHYYDLCKKINGDNGFKKLGWLEFKKSGWPNKYYSVLLPYPIAMLGYWWKDRKLNIL